ncbi:MAG: protein-L-isoaspartate(D-aspartate) O-methyltransferase [Myxococcota bacterium]
MTGRRLTLFTLLFFSTLIYILSCFAGERPANQKKKENFIKMRSEMVEFQLRHRDIKDTKVLNAMNKVPRERFVPESLKDRAYDDGPLPIGEGQTISQPYIVAYMTEQLRLKGEEKVLEIGTGSGYQAAILAEIAKEVYTIEIIETLSKRAEKTLTELGYKNIKFKVGDGYFGWKEFAPFDAIIITAAPHKIPDTLIEQLKVGGRLIAPVGDMYQELVLITKTENGITRESLIPVIFVPMRGEIERQR